MEKNLQPIHAVQKSEAQIKKELTYKRDKDRENVRGVFRFYEVPGGSMSFVYRAYKGDEVQTYNLIDGEIYTLPLGVAKHLNKNCWYPVHAYQTDENGKPVARINQRIRRAGFQSLEFIDPEDIGESKEIIQADSLIG